MFNKIRGIRIDGNTVNITVDRVSVQHVVRHSPTGMEWGYPGSGPADAALSILTHIKGKAVADKYYQMFKWEFLVKLLKEGFSIVVDVGYWLKTK